MLNSPVSFSFVGSLDQNPSDECIQKATFNQDLLSMNAHRNPVFSTASLPDGTSKSIFSHQDIARHQSPQILTIAMRSHLGLHKTHMAAPIEALGNQSKGKFTDGGVSSTLTKLSRIMSRFA